jgi:hypothetical protein
MYVYTTYTGPLLVQAQHSISSSCYNTSLVTWTVLCLTAAKLSFLYVLCRDSPCPMWHLYCHNLEWLLLVACIIRHVKCHVHFANRCGARQRPYLILINLRCGPRTENTLRTPYPSNSSILLCCHGNSFVNIRCRGNKYLLFRCLAMDIHVTIWRIKSLNLLHVLLVKFTFDFQLLKLRFSSLTWLHSSIEWIQLRL